MKDVCGYEGLYKVDENGNVFSVRNNKFLKRMTFPSGYEYVHLCNGKGKTKLFRVHRLVAEMFIPNPNNLPEVNHKDGDKLNNNVKNLEWCTNLENMRHSVETGLRNVKGENNPSAKLTVKDVVNIRKEYIPKSKEFGTVALARKYGVTNVMIGKIIRNECWFDADKSQHRKAGDI